MHMDVFKRGAAVFLVVVVGSLVGGKLVGSLQKAHADGPQDATRRIELLQARIDTLQAQQAAEMQLHEAQVRSSFHQPAAPEGNASASASSAVQDPTPPPLSPEAQAALERANGLVDGAIQSGRWGTDQVQQFRELAMGIPVAEKMEVVRKLAVAINSGKVHVTAHGFPL
jgi:hypothetical protein